jgi:peptidyl-prolyl cis-trans isomerase C
MKHSTFRATLAGACAAVALIATPALAQNIAVVNGKPIPKARADEIIAELVKSGQKETTELDEKVKETLITRELVMQEADKRKLGQDPLVQQSIENSRQQVLFSALAIDYMKANPPTEAEMHQKYDEVVARMIGKEYKVHHILVAKETDAAAILKQLKAGASFEELATKSSIDSGSAAKGGDLSWIATDTLVPEFADALTKLQKGAYTKTPVKTQFGYHIIRLDDVRDRKIDPYEEVKPRVAEILSQDRKWQDTRIQAMIADLKSKAKIE